MTYGTTPLADVLAEQLRCAEAMLSALDREAAALLDARHDDLDAAVSAKNRLIAALEALERERLELTAALQASIEEPGARERWSNLLELVGRCRERNRSNGALLGARRASLEKIMVSLRGDAAPSSYGADGRKGVPQSARALGSA